MPNQSAPRTEPAPETVERFVSRWEAAGSSERANYQLFVTELTDLLGFPKPDSARDDSRDNAYVFERRVTFRRGNGRKSQGFIACFAKNAMLSCWKPRGCARVAGKGFDDALQRARGQAEAYARALPADGKAGKESAAPGGAPAPAGRIPWPDKLPRQVAAVARILGESPVPLSEARIPARFAGRGLCKKRLRQLVETLVALRRARVADGR